MKVLKMPPAGHIWITCTCCGSLLEVSKGDVSLRDIGFGNAYAADCVCCGYFLILFDDQAKFLGVKR